MMFDMLKYELPPMEYCREYLKSSKSCYTIGPRLKDILTSGLNMMQDCISSIEKIDTPHNQFSYGVIEQGLTVLLQITSEFKNEKYFDKFIADYVFLAHNVNMNTIKNDFIENKCRILDRFAKKTQTFTDTLIMFNETTNRLSQWKNFVPPSFKLSRHYLDVIKEE
jgi:hypothetical protein